MALNPINPAPNNCSFNFKYSLFFAAGFNAHFGLASALGF
jgi:hypothetical protein